MDHSVQASAMIVPLWAINKISPLDLHEILMKPQVNKLQNVVGSSSFAL